MKNTNAVRTEIHYAQVGEYQLPLLTLPQTDDTELLGKYGRMRLAYLKNQRPVLYNQIDSLTTSANCISQIWCQSMCNQLPLRLTSTPRRTKSAHSFSGWRT